MKACLVTKSCDFKKRNGFYSILEDGMIAAGTKKVRIVCFDKVMD